MALLNKKQGSRVYSNAGQPLLRKSEDSGNSVEDPGPQEDQVLIRLGNGSPMGCNDVLFIPTQETTIND